MTLGRGRYALPPIWDDATLERQRREAITDFITERATEGGRRYQASFAQMAASVESLFTETRDLLDFRSGAALAANPRLVQPARYLGGPPISADDLDTLAEARIAARKRLDADLGRKAATVIQAAIDPERFLWLFVTPQRAPTRSERDTAIRWTAGLMTVEAVKTERRGESAKQQEEAVAKALRDLGFTQVPRRPITITGGLAPGEFCNETVVEGTKCDVPIGLRDGRFLFVECKVSNSFTNSVKRLNREVGGKASKWAREFGQRAITAAVLTGVFKLKNLQDAQSAGVVIFWARDLAPLSDFLRAAG